MVPKPTVPDPSAQPIDPGCALGQPNATTEVLVPKWPALANTVPSDCLVGFEMNNLERSTYSVSSKGSRAITLEVDIATYTAADQVRISAFDATKKETLLVDTCRLRTATYSDPTGGTVRPPEESIRDFRVALPAGTTTLEVDNTGALTPTYVRILGLCDFDPMTAPPGLPAGQWRRVTAR
jgi:hypothetical protein